MGVWSERRPASRELEPEPGCDTTAWTISVQSLNRLYHCPALLLITVAASIFLAEAAVMKALSFFTWLSNPILFLADSLLLTALLLPPLIILVFRPIDLHLAQRRRVEEELAAERNKLKDILDTMPAGVCIINSSLKLEYANSSLLREFGPAGDRSCQDYFPGWPVSLAECCREAASLDRSCIKEWRCESGTVYEIFETPLKNADGTFSTLHMVHDITQRKSAENELRASRERLRSLSNHLQQGREEERKAISREIHDELGQVLATVQLGVSSLAEEYRDHRHLAARIAGMEKLLGSAIRTIQRIATRLRPSILDDLGLAEAIRWHTAEFRARTGIACTVDILLTSTIPCEVATEVFRIFQEALTNVMRHAAASRVDASLEERKGRLVLIIADDGRGITPDQLRDGGSLGITGMRERAYALGGRFRICRTQQRATVVIARLPLPASGAQP